MKLEELVILLDKCELVKIYINDFIIFNGKILDFEHLNYKNLEVDEIFSYGDIKDCDTLFSVMCIYCKSQRDVNSSLFLLVGGILYP